MIEYEVKKMAFRKVRNSYRPITATVQHRIGNDWIAMETRNGGEIKYLSLRNKRNGTGGDWYFDKKKGVVIVSVPDGTGYLKGNLARVEYKTWAGWMSGVKREFQIILRKV